MTDRREGADGRPDRLDGPDDHDDHDDHGDPEGAGDSTGAGSESATLDPGAVVAPPGTDRRVLVVAVESGSVCLAPVDDLRPGLREWVRHGAGEFIVGRVRREASAPTVQWPRAWLSPDDVATDRTGGDLS